MASVRAQFVSRSPGPSKYNPTVTVHGRIYHEIWALEPATGMLPRFASLYIHDTKNATSNRKHFYSSLRESLLNRLALMSEESNNFVNYFVSLRTIIQRNALPNDVKLVIHAHKKLFQGMFENTMYLKQVKSQS